MNPYDPPETTWHPKPSVRLHWFAFASAATVAYGVTSCIHHYQLYAGSRPFITTPTQFASDYLPFFAYSGMVGAVNLLSPRRGWFRYSPVSVRLVGGMLLGLVPIPLFIVIQPYLWILEPVVPFNVVDDTIVLLVPVMFCTVVERLILKFCVPESVPSAIG